MANKDTVKQQFLTGKIPTQAQYHQLFDWIYWKDELIPIAGINGLQTILDTIIATAASRPQELNVSTNTTFAMLAKYRLVNIAVKNNHSAAMTLIFNTVPAGVVELFRIDVGAGDTYDLDIGQTYWADTVIEISGITGPVTILIDRR